MSLREDDDKVEMRARREAARARAIVLYEHLRAAIGRDTSYLEALPAAPELYPPAYLSNTKLRLPATDELKIVTTMLRRLADCIDKFLEPLGEWEAADAACTLAHKDE
jgi:hypothetical protein